MSLTDAEHRTLAYVAALMIPASTRHGVPGADDPAILGDMARSLGRDAPAIRSALARLDVLAGGSLPDAAPAQRGQAASAFRAEGGVPLATLTRVILQSYYRDDRVMRALGMEPRPPFPKGHEVAQGDWSLLDPVRDRAKVWRDVPPDA